MAQPPDIEERQNNQGQPPSQEELERFFELIASDNKEDTRRAAFLAGLNPKLIYTPNKDGHFAAHIAAATGNTNMLQVIASHNPKLLQAQDKEGLSVLHHSVINLNYETTSKLIDIAPGLLHSVDKHGFTPLHLAAQNDPTMVDLILTKAPHLAGVNTGKMGVALHSAAIVGKNGDIVDRLIQADPSMILEKDSMGMTPIDIALTWADLDTAKPLIDEYMQNHDLCEYRNRHGDNMLHMAARNGDLKTVKYLIEQSPELLNQKNNDGENILNKAALSGNKELVDFLIKQKPELLNDYDAQSPGRSARSKGYDELGDHIDEERRRYERDKEAKELGLDLDPDTQKRVREHGIKVEKGGGPDDPFGPEPGTSNNDKKLPYTEVDEDPFKSSPPPSPGNGAANSSAKGSSR